MRKDYLEIRNCRLLCEKLASSVTGFTSLSMSTHLWGLWGSKLPYTKFKRSPGTRGGIPLPGVSNFFSLSDFCLDCLLSFPRHCTYPT
jgi:hypothetical protein